MILFVRVLICLFRRSADSPGALNKQMDQDLWPAICRVQHINKNWQLDASTKRYLIVNAA